MTREVLIAKELILCKQHSMQSDLKVLELSQTVQHLMEEEKKRKKRRVRKRNRKKKKKKRKKRKRKRKRKKAFKGVNQPLFVHYFHFFTYCSSFNYFSSLYETMIWKNHLLRMRKTRTQNLILMISMTVS